MTPADRAVEAALDAFKQAERNIHGYTYGETHVIRDHAKPAGEDQLWSGLAGDALGAAAMLEELERIVMRRALAAAEAVYEAEGWKRGGVQPADGDAK